MQILIVALFFSACFAAMALGVLVSNRELKGSCGGADPNGPLSDVVSCGACAKKEAEVCPSDDPLVGLAQIAHPNPRHHH